MLLGISIGLGGCLTAQDFNNDGYLDYLYNRGTMKPNNIEINGEVTFSLWGEKM